MSPLISVVIATYNSEKFIKKCLGSVIKQDYFPIEIIIGDGGSTDRTIEIIKEIIKKKKKRKIYLLKSEKKKSLSENVNACLNKCRGKYISLLAGDDSYYQKKISKQVKFMEANPQVGICYHDMRIINVKKKTAYYYNYKKIGFYKGDYFTLLKNYCFCGASSCFIRNYKLPRFNKKLKYNSDYLFFIELLIKQNSKIDYIKGAYTRYLIHGSNLTQNFNVFSDVVETIYLYNYLIRKYFKISLRIYFYKLKRLNILLIKSLLNLEIFSFFICLIEIKKIIFLKPFSFFCKIKKL